MATELAPVLVPAWAPRRACSHSLASTCASEGAGAVDAALPACCAAWVMAAGAIVCWRERGREGLPPAPMRRA